MLIWWSFSVCESTLLTDFLDRYKLKCVKWNAYSLTNLKVVNHSFKFRYSLLAFYQISKFCNCKLLFSINCLLYFALALTMFNRCWTWIYVVTIVFVCKLHCTTENLVYRLLNYDKLNLWMWRVIHIFLLKMKSSALGHKI